MFFKVDFAKAYDSVRWDYLLDVLEAFGFGQTWCNWIRGTFSSARASVLVNGSLSNEFSFYCGLKQGDPLSHFLFILIMESLHLSFLDRAVDEGIINILKCFFLASGLKINIHKSQLLGVGIPRNVVTQAAASLGCGVMLNQFRYLGVMVGKCMSRHQAWDDVVLKLRSRLSNWKVWRIVSQEWFRCGYRVIHALVLGPAIDSSSGFRIPSNVVALLFANYTF
ncbi:RNA-directed DNA polymerase, eukaryota [Tanacetum coccineum]